MTPIPVDGPMLDGRDDYIPDAALDKIDALIAALPESWETGSMQAHTRSVTVTIRFDGVTGPMAQADAADRLLACGTFIGALARNLAVGTRPTDRTRNGRRCVT